MAAQGQNMDGIIKTPVIVQVTGGPEKRRTVISGARDCFIEILHRDSDPGTWIVRRWKKYLCLKKRISSDWFTDRKQAYRYAYDMNQKNRHHRLGDAREL
jgi:hypothetical protein